MATLEISGLRLSVGETSILRGIDLSVDKGEVVGLIGESGSGKSLTALSIMQLLPPRAQLSGSVRLDGLELLGQAEPVLNRLRGARIGMVFQEPMTALNPVLSIGAQIAEAVRIHQGMDKVAAEAAALELLDRVELTDSGVTPDRFPHELSGGQRQRVVIAMAIANRPDLLIADEPTTALDVTTQAQILTLLDRLVDQDGMALLLISHDLGVVAQRADRMAIMRNGEIVEQGPTLPLFGNLKHPYSQALLAAARHDPQRVRFESVAAPMAVEVSDLVCTYHRRPVGLFRRPSDFRAVDGVTFAIAQGESVGLVGESGCGKSTLARAVLGLEPIHGGAIRLGGSTVAAGKGPTLEQRRQVQMVFQDPFGSFDPRQRVSALVAEPLHLLGKAAPAGNERRDLVERALADVGLDGEAAERYIHEFSGGQRQRIAIARALLIRPKLIVLDEPVSALDVSVRAQILDLLADLQQRLRLSYLFISHDLGVVRSITDRVFVMRTGKVVESGSTDDVFASPEADYTRSLLAASPVLDEILARRAGDAGKAR